WQLFRHARWPQVAPLAAAAWYITYLLCLWDTETLILIMPPGAETLAVRVFNFLHYGHNAQVNALCLILLMLAVLPLLLWAIVKTIAGAHPTIGRLMRCAASVTLILFFLSFAGCAPSSTSEASID